MKTTIIAKTSTKLLHLRSYWEEWNWNVTSSHKRHIELQICKTYKLYRWIL